MNAILHCLYLNYAVILFIIAVLVVAGAVVTAMYTVFGWYAFIFLFISLWIAFAVSAGFINFTLGA